MNVITNLNGNKISSDLIQMSKEHSKTLTDELDNRTELIWSGSTGTSWALPTITISKSLFNYNKLYLLFTSASGNEVLDCPIIDGVIYDGYLWLGFTEMYKSYLKSQSSTTLQIGVVYWKNSSNNAIVPITKIYGIKK